MITLTDKDFNSGHEFINKSYFNADNDRYEFNDNLVVDVKYSIFKKSIYVRGDQYVQGHQYVQGDQDVRGDQVVQGDQEVLGFKLLKSNGRISVNFIGSRKSATKFLFTRESGIMVKCGCYFGTIDNFKTRVSEVHKDNQFAHEYFNAIEYAIKMYDYYKAREPEYV